MPIALNIRAWPHLLAGEFAAAAALITRLEAVTEATGSSLAPYAALVLAALRGREAEAARLIEAGMNEAERRGQADWLTFAQWATAMLHNSLGRYERALAAAEQASQDSPVLWAANWAVAELIEAATRSGAPERAAPALRAPAQMARPTGTDWALGIEARGRALADEGEAAGRLYRDAIDWLGRTTSRARVA